MAPVWDPFADCGGAAPPSNDENAAPKNLGKLSGSLKSKIIAHISSGLRTDAPWKKTPDMTPVLDVMVQTCKSDDWRHKDVKLEISQGIAYVILNRPNENNSLQDSLGNGLSDATICMHQRRDLRIVVLTGEGRMFCAGGDPKSWQANAARARGEQIEGDGSVGNRIEYAEPTEKTHKAWYGGMERGIRSGAFPMNTVGVGQLIAAQQWKCWATLPQFTICIANGSSMGGGLGWNCCCDYLISLKKAFFVLSEVKIGVVPATISPYVIRKMGPSHAKRLFCTAENLKGEKAVEVGMANEVAENMAEAHKRVKELCKVMTLCGPSASLAFKDLFLCVTGQPISEPVMSLTQSCLAKSVVNDEGIEGIDVVKSGKTPSWESTMITCLY